MTAQHGFEFRGINHLALVCSARVGQDDSESGISEFACRTRGLTPEDVGHRPARAVDRTTA